MAGGLSLAPIRVEIHMTAWQLQSQLTPIGMDNVHKCRVRFIQSTVQLLKVVTEKHPCRVQSYMYVNDTKIIELSPFGSYAMDEFRWLGYNVNMYP